MLKRGYQIMKSYTLYNVVPKDYNIRMTYINKCFCGNIRCNLHRESKSIFYKKWWHIRARCTFKWDKDFHNYGGRGIKFEWATYLDFKRDMYDSYLEHVKKHGEKNTTVERIDSNKNYSKENCRWATTKEQSRNKRTSKFLTINGVTKNYVDWANKIGCSRQALRYRVVNGWKPEDILTIPFLHSNKYDKTV